MKITCPECGYSSEVDAGRIPAGGTTAGCPRCRARFRIAAEEPAAAVVEELFVICPSCANEQPISTVCERCGVVFARYRKVAKYPVAGSTAPAEPSSPEPERPRPAPPGEDSGKGPAKESWRRKLRSNRSLRLPLAFLFLLGVWLLVKDVLPTTVVRNQNTLSAAAGERHAVVARKDGMVWCWGSNSHGQLGVPASGAAVSAPVKVPGIEGVTRVAAGALHTLALKADGSVFGWGSNEHGQLGISSGEVNATAPVRVAGLSGVTAIAAGDYFSVALTRDGTLWYFGDSFLGHLSNGGINHEIAVPTPVAGLSDVAAVACGRRSIAALKKDGTVWCWGENAQGEVGDGSFAPRWEPVVVKGLVNVKAVAAGERFTLALKEDGTVWGWGSLQIDGGEGLERSPQPKQLVHLKGVREIGAGYWHAVALKENGTVWHSGTSGGAPQGDTGSHFWNVLKRSAKGGVSAIFTGGTESFLEMREGLLLRLASGEVGQVRKSAAGKAPALSTISFDEAASARLLSAPAPDPVTAPRAGLDLQGVAAGRQHSLALGGDGAIWAWGNNEGGQLGRRRGSREEVAGQIMLSVSEPFKKARAVAGGEQFTVAVQQDGSLWQWGTVVSQPGEKVRPSLVGPLIIFANVAAVSAGPSYYMVQMQDGTIGVCGRSVGIDAQRGPERVPGLTDVVGISAGTNHRAVLKRDGTIWCWGKNDRGQLGDGSRETRTTPVLARCRGVVKVAAGSDFTLVLKSDGTVWGWGANVHAVTEGGLVVRDSAEPVRIPGLENIKDIAVPAYSYSNGGHVLALDRHGAVWSRGFNDFGQLGQGTKSFSYVQTPARVVGLKDVVAIAAGMAHSLALDGEGTLWAWGKNFRGELGSGSTADSAVPVRVQFETSQGGSSGSRP